MNEMRDMIKQVLETPYWIPTLKADKPYFLSNDDCDGNLHQGISVTIDSQGDAWISINGERKRVSDMQNENFCRRRA